MTSSPPPTPPPPGPGNLRPTAPSAVAGWAAAGLAGGWLVHTASDRWGATAPLITWVQPLTLLLVALLLAGAAHATWRSVHVRRERLVPHQAVNRLLLARACLYVGALAAGGYLGYALSWLGIDADLAQQRLVRSLVAAVAGVLVVVAALALERSCRVRRDDPRPSDGQRACY